MTNTPIRETLEPTPTPVNGGLSVQTMDAEAAIQSLAQAQDAAADQQSVRKEANTDKDADLRELWTDDGLNDPLTTQHYHKVPIGKPKNFFRVHPAREYRRKCEILALKSENSIEESYHLIGSKMRGKIDEARPCTLITVVDRLGYPRLWPLIEPPDGENDNEAWSSARAVARQGLENWVKPLWKGRAYISREAEKGYAPEPDWKKLPPFSDLIRTAFGEQGIINDESHSVYRDLFGITKKSDENEDPFS